MAGTGADLPVPAAGGVPVLIVEARYHQGIADLLLAGARRTLEAAGAKVETVTVAGALEVPIAVAMAAETRRFQAFVALGCVIRGETTHYDLVAGESCRGLMDLGLTRQLAIGNGILTVENEAQALERADPARQDKGGDAARAALTLLHLARGWAGDAD